MSSIDQQVAVIRGPQELFRRTGHLFDTAREEVSCAANDLYTWAWSRRPFPDDAEPMRHPASVRVRKLYRPSLLLDPSQAQMVARIAQKGAEVRISAEDLNETIIIDRRIVILAGDTSHGERSFSVVSLPEVVQGVCSLFEAAWNAATALADFDRDLAEVRVLAPRILEQLNTGATDESAAGVLGLSVRTYRRRVAELMSALGAGSRFQAGVRARELGLI